MTSTGQPVLAIMREVLCGPLLDVRIHVIAGGCYRGLAKQPTVRFQKRAWCFDGCKETQKLKEMNPVHLPAG